MLIYREQEIQRLDGNFSVNTTGRDTRWNRLGQCLQFEFDLTDEMK